MGRHNDQTVYIIGRQFGVQFKDRGFSASENYRNDLPQEIVGFPSLVLYQLAGWPLRMGVRYSYIRQGLSTGKA